MTGNSKILVSISLVVLIGGCQTIGSSPSDLIVGAWTSDVGGFPIMVEYTDSTVRIEGHEAVPYQLNDDNLLVAGETRSLSFPTSDEMIQTDPLTSTDRVYVRLR